MMRRMGFTRRLFATSLLIIAASCSLGGSGGRETVWSDCTKVECPTAPIDRLPLVELDQWQGSLPWDASLGGAEPSALVASAAAVCADCTSLVWMLEPTSEEWSDVDDFKSSLAVRVTAIAIDDSGVERIAVVLEGQLNVVVTNEGLQRAQALGVDGSPWLVEAVAYEIELP